METPPHKPAPPTGLREGLARALEAGGPECRPPGPLPAERVGRAVEAPPGQTPAVGARRASAAGSEEPETATHVGRRRDTPRPVLRASDGQRWRGAVDNLPERARIADASPGESGPGEGAPGQCGHEKSQGPTEQHSGGKSQGLQDRTGERSCGQRPARTPLQKQPSKPPGPIGEKAVDPGVGKV